MNATNANKSFILPRAGFTLIELLVVVAIIGVLFAVALPVFENAGRKDTNRAAQQVINSLRLARQHAVAKRQWTFVVFPNADGKYSADPKAVNTIDKCLRSYAVIAVTNNMDEYWGDRDGPTVDDMRLEFVSDWKYLPEGIYFDDDDGLTGNYLFGRGGYYKPPAPRFHFPFDPADPNPNNPQQKKMIMSAVLFKPNGRIFTMFHSGKHWRDTTGSRLYVTAAKFYEPIGTDLGDPKPVPGTNTMIQFQAKTGMVKIMN